MNEPKLTLRSLYNNFVSSKEGTWIMIPVNAEHLYNFVKEKDVKNILDLGTGIGCSAAMMALALKDKGVKGRIDTVDQFDKCIRIAKELIPKELQEYITFHKAEAVAWEHETMPYQYYSVFDKLPEAPNGGWDMVVNDAPAMFLKGDYMVDIPNGTITKMLIEKKIKAGTYIVWDGRLQALKLLERFYGDNFYISQMAKKGEDFNVLKRKDNEIAYRDTTLEIMNNLGYFKDEKDIVSNNSKTPSASPKTAS